MICLLCTYPLPGYFFGNTYALYPLMTRNLMGALLYLWSKRNPRAMIQLNFVPMEGRYLPFAHIGIALFMNNRLHELIVSFFQEIGVFRVLSLLTLSFLLAWFRHCTYILFSDCGCPRDSRWSTNIAHTTDISRVDWGRRKRDTRRRLRTYSATTTI